MEGEIELVGAAERNSMTGEVEQQQVLGLIGRPVQHLADRPAGRPGRDGDADLGGEPAEARIGEDGRQVAQIGRDLRHVRQLLVLVRG